MSRSRRKQFSLGIGADALTLVDLAVQRPLTSLPLAAYVPGVANPAHADWAPAMAALVAQADLAGGADLQVTVADVWARYWMFAVPAGVSSLAELQALAAARFETLFGAPPEGWSLMADWRASGQVLVCALPERLLEALQMLPPGWRVGSIQPGAIRLLGSFQRQIPDEGWVACFGQGGLLLFLVSRGEVCHVRRHPLAAPPDLAQLQILLEAEMLRLGLENVDSLCILGQTEGFEPAAKPAGMRLLQPQRSPANRTVLSESLALALQGVKT